MTLFIVIKKCPTVFAKSLKRILIFFLFSWENHSFTCSIHIYRESEIALERKHLGGVLFLLLRYFASQTGRHGNAGGNIVMNCLWGK